MFRCLTAAAATLALATPVLAQDPHGAHAGLQPSGHSGMDHGQHAGHDPHAGHGAPSAQAIVTVPADGAMLMGPPDQFTITFPHPMRLTGLTLRSQGQAETAVALETAAPAMTSSASLPTLAPATYSLSWTAEGEDGHAMTGTIGFMVH